MFTLEDILSIPTYSGNEIRMQEYLLELLPNFSGVTVEIDENRIDKSGNSINNFLIFSSE